MHLIANAAVIPEAERGDMLNAFHKRLISPDRDVRIGAARAWSRWEGETISIQGPSALPSRFNEDRFVEAFARIECHYFVNEGFFPHDGWLLDQAPIFRKIPGRIAHGRYDMCTPLASAWALKKAWPEVQLDIIANAGHSSLEPGIVDSLIRATEAMLTEGTLVACGLERAPPGADAGQRPAILTFMHLWRRRDALQWRTLDLRPLKIALAKLRRERNARREIGAQRGFAGRQGFLIRRGDVVAFLRLAQALARFTGAAATIERADELLRIRLQGFRRRRRIRRGRRCLLAQTIRFGKARARGRCRRCVAQQADRVARRRLRAAPALRCSAALVADFARPLRFGLPLAAAPLRLRAQSLCASAA